jgi:hypothetical protein
MARSFKNGAWTSAHAAKEAEQFKPQVRHEILAELHVRKELGATDQELERAIGRPGNTLRPGRVDLVKEGLVVDSLKWRFTEARRPAKVWVLAIYDDEKPQETQDQ